MAEPYFDVYRYRVKKGPRRGEVLWAWALYEGPGPGVVLAARQGFPDREGCLASVAAARWDGVAAAVAECLEDKGGIWE